MEPLLDRLPHLVTLVHAACLAPLAAYGAHRLLTLDRSRRARASWRDRGRPPALAARAWPTVVVQLPLYDERHVAARLIEAVGALEYPPERLHVQVLDDSTDDTRGVVDVAVAALVRRGIRASVLRRSERTGFKAGALAAGLEACDEEFVAVFDADFVPAPDFLRRLVPELDDPAVGMVQARWDHLARDESALARAQAVLLDGHFAVEHAARHGVGLWFNFNGTAGIWRRTAIESAGGWQHDTLTEDLDLSYRAQLLGWRFVYRPDVAVPAELPGSLGAFFGQQRRWARGGVQVLRKLAGRLARARAPRRLRAEALVHLTANVGYPLLVALACAMPLLSFAGERLGNAALVLVFLCCTASVVAFYAHALRRVERSGPRAALDVTLAVLLGIGMSVAQTRAVVDGWRRSTGTFERTPKRGGTSARVYRPRPRAWPVAELLLAAWLTGGAGYAALSGWWGALPFQLLFAAGFLWVAVLACRERSAEATEAGRLVPARRARPAPPRPFVAAEAEPVAALTRRDR